MSESQLTEARKSESSSVQSQFDREAVLRPPVDVYEDGKGITLVADLPGVSRDRLNIQVDQNTLTIEGQMVIDMPEGMESLYADVRGTRFQRSFSLSSELEVDKIEAQMKDGVLTLMVPKRAELQPHKIEIKAG
ncbi:MAG: Hsp20/alpha crystallin family protein [Methylobacter sp.]